MAATVVEMLVKYAPRQNIIQETVLSDWMKLFEFMLKGHNNDAL